ncbi:MAG: hypothetical protein EZS28_015493 [Streblomastix strix]|uniref:Uncharacterized protein n=1 Tax=Streblomastix strix TaxID=222440 RepID=A0A5J4W243_9EUKA|nr:MAG: hypothetical protein EZS28_015493 [Streblomastix strix]
MELELQELKMSIPEEIKSIHYQYQMIYQKGDTGTGAIGTATIYSRDDHQHILNTDPTVGNISVKDTGSGNKGNYNYQARSNHAHPLNVDPTVSYVPLVNATAAANGTSDQYCRNDHVHPQQLTCDDIITTTKFIKKAGLATEILLAYGSTTPLVLAQREYCIVRTTQQIKLRTFNAYAYLYSASDEFTFNCRSEFGSLQFNQTYTTNGLVAQQYKLQNNFDYGMQASYILYYETGADRYGELQAKVQSQSNQLMIKQTDSSLGIDPLANVLNIGTVSALLSGYSMKYII